MPTPEDLFSRLNEEVLGTFNRSLAEIFEPFNKQFYFVNDGSSPQGNTESATVGSELLDVVLHMGAIAASDFHRFVISEDNSSPDFAKEAELHVREEVSVIGSSPTYLRIAAVSVKHTDIPGPPDVISGDGNSFYNIDEGNFGYSWITSSNHSILYTKSIDVENDKKYISNIKEYTERKVNLVQAAIKEHRADIICLGEFDFPPILSNKVSLRRSLQENELYFIERINAAYREMLADYDGALNRDFILCAGTRYEVGDRVDPSKLMDVGNIAHYCIAKYRSGKAVTDSSKTSPELLENIYWDSYRKRTAAVKAGERFSFPDGIKVDIIRLTFGTVMILVCSDAYDPNIMYALYEARLRLMLEKKKIDFIVVPSYNESLKLGYMCQVISFMSKSILILVDVCQSKTNSRVEYDKTQVYIDGVKVNFESMKEVYLERQEDIHHEPVGEFCRRVATDSSGDLQVFELNLDVLRDKRLRALKRSDLVFNKNIYLQLKDNFKVK